MDPCAASDTRSSRNCSSTRRGSQYAATQRDRAAESSFSAQDVDRGENGTGRMHSNRCIEIDVQTRYVQDGSLQRTWLLSRVGRSRHSLDRASGVDHGDVEELGRGDADIRQTPRHVQQVSQPLASRIDAVAAGQGLVSFISTCCGRVEEL